MKRVYLCLFLSSIFIYEGVIFALEYLLVPHSVTEVIKSNETAELVAVGRPLYFSDWLNILEYSITNLNVGYVLIFIIMASIIMIVNLLAHLS